MELTLGNFNVGPFLILVATYRNAKLDHMKSGVILLTLSANPINWSSTLKQFVGTSRLKAKRTENFHW